MEKSYKPQDIETHWYRYWEENGCFSPGGTARQPYCIMLPPPNVTGSLHMGHAFQQTLIDILIRYQRMRGLDTLWQSGTDHAGIATQMLVERQLETQGQSRHALGREAFVQAVWDWKQQSGDRITRQTRRLGSSMDWTRSRFTMDPEMSAAVTEVFLRLHEKGLIYRGKRLVNWDPVLHTAISDLEVVSSEETGSLWHIRYPLADGGDGLVVATTRPETLLGDMAVAVHPEDTRYSGMVGKALELPLSGRHIPVIADPHVDPEYGSGCLKITPAHDFNDYEVGLRHQLSPLNIFTASACLNENVPKRYQGMDRYLARQRILEDLEAARLLVRTEEHRMMIPRGDRSHAVTEPWLTDQWYVRVAPLAERAIHAVEKGDIRFVPENWSRTYFEWMRNIQDWCISRQLWWGHRIPAWYDTAGNVYVGQSEDAVRKANGLDAELPLRQDEDVLDTWFSSALWPFSALGWPQQTAELKRYYPTSVLVTGFDIIFFWVARMIMMGLECMDAVPFRTVYIHGLVRDSEGQKMSKSKGNILDPIDLIDGIDLEALVKKRTSGLLQAHLAPGIAQQTRKQYPDGIAACGTDALRFTFASLATLGRDIRFDTGRIQGYRNFCNKLWNAARYVDMTLERADMKNTGESELGLAERWIGSRLTATVTAVDRALADYRFDLASQALYEFTWNEYCDWYLELSKPVLNDDTSSAERKRGTLQTLAGTLETLLRLLHPFIPFITEALWQKIAPLTGVNGDTIMLQQWPDSGDMPYHADTLAVMDWLQHFVAGVRKIRSERNIAPGKTLSVLVMNGNPQERQWLDENRPLICHLARLDSIRTADSEPAASITALAGQMSLFVPLADILDTEHELQRLQKKLAALAQEEAQLQTRLDNPDFVRNAPAEIVEKVRGRLEKIRYTGDRMQEQYQRIATK